MSEFSRTKLLIGTEGINKLRHSRVAVFGIGGVGSFTIEALIRGGVGNITIVDNDEVCPTNINRQLIATNKTIGRPKVEVMGDRILEINPKVKVMMHRTFYTGDNAWEFDLSQYDYIVDAIDTVSSKLVLIENAKACNTPIISCMGAGNKLDPIGFEVADIYKTSVCPLARVMRYELRKRGIDALKVVYSKEPPIRPAKHPAGIPLDIADPSPTKSQERTGKRHVPGSISFVPPVAGLIIAGEVIRDILGIDSQAKFQ
ncbi:MAG TPA: tRNA threonylcarbamoyladenosine dehydratase [Clostridia bacterium]|nr:tRNA threonylcarbamoyladenosine dehydratase [Clostridia bacterium]